MTSTVEQQISNYVASDATTDAAALHGATRCLLDWLGATIAGASHPLPVSLRTALGEQIGHGSATLIPDGDSGPVVVAALINGAASHVMEFDDIYRDALYHPASPVISASLAVCQSRHRSGGELLQAIIKGYEVSNRIGVLCNPAHYRYWHTTATVGTLGAAVGASAALGLAADLSQHAVANAASLAAGLQQAFRSDAMTKALHVGRAAESGVLCALTAEQGVTGATAMLTGEVGFGRAMSNAPDWQAGLVGLGDEFTIAHTTHKNHGCCGHIFASIDAVQVLARTESFSVDEIDTIDVATYQAALDITGRTRPTTAAEGRFSTPWCVSAALVMGAVRLNAFSEKALGDQSIVALAERVKMTCDAEIQKQFPKKRQARVSIKLSSGRVLEHYAQTRHGDPDDPLSDNELNEKFFELVAPSLGESRTKALAERVWAIDDVENVAQLLLQ